MHPFQDNEGHCLIELLATIHIVTLGGILIVVSDEQSKKALSPIVIRASLNSTSDNVVHPSNAWFSMEVTLGGILMERSDVQFMNAHCPSSTRVLKICIH